MRVRRLGCLMFTFFSSKALFIQSPVLLNTLHDQKSLKKFQAISRNYSMS